MKFDASAPRVVEFPSPREATLDALRKSGMEVRKHRLRTAINEDRARDWIKLAREEGASDTDIRSALGFSMDEYRDLLGR